MRPRGRGSARRSRTARALTRPTKLHRRRLGPPGTASGPAPGAGSAPGPARGRRVLGAPLRDREAPRRVRLVLDCCAAYAHRRGAIRAPPTPSGRQPRRRSERSDCPSPVTAGATTGPRMTGLPQTTSVTTGHHLPNSATEREQVLQVATTWLGSLTRKRSHGRAPSLRSAKASAPGWAEGAEGWLLRTVPLCVIPEGVGTVNAFGDGGLVLCALPCVQRAAVIPLTGLG
jgi:hypothetical protein